MAKPTLYLFIRNDVQSMTPGKGIAQGSHVTDLFEKTMDSARAKSERWDGHYRRWAEDGVAGRALVMGADGADFSNLAYLCRCWDETFIGHSDILHGSYTDPTYPVRDGAVTHLVPFNSAMFIFVRDTIETLGYPSSRYGEDSIVSSNLIHAVKSLKMY